MKKYMTRALALLLTVVMVLGAVPFAMAQEPSVTVTARTEKVWPGQTVRLTMTPGGEIPTSGVKWDNGDNAHSSDFRVPEDATGTVTTGVEVTFGQPGSQSVVRETITLTVNTPAGEDFAVSGPKEARVGEFVTFTAENKNDSNVTWSVTESGATITGGRFKASQAGTYTVVATAQNGGAIAAVTDETTIDVKEADYTVTLSGGTFLLGATGEKLSYTVKSAAGETVTADSVAFSSDDPSVVTVDSDGTLTLKKKGTAKVTIDVIVEGEIYSDEATVTVSDKGTISCAQDMTSVSGDSMDMTFVFKGAGDNEVQWTVSATGEEDFSVSETSFTDDGSATVTVYADDGIGIAKVSVSAKVGDIEAEGTFYVSFYEKNHVVVEVEEGVKEFDFDENGVFSKVNYSSANAGRQNLHGLIADGSGTRVVLTEDNRTNARVGKITKDTKSSFQQYDPDDENDYAMTELEKLNFEVKGEGEYELEYEVYDTVGGKGLTTSKGTITIVTGEGDADLTYKCANAGTVDLDAEDFVKFWENFLEEEDEDEEEELLYVTFDVATVSSTNGVLTTDGKTVKSTWKFYEDPSSSQYDLDEIVYKASSTNKNYTDYIAFTCVGEDQSETSGVLSVVVGGTNAKMSFTDVKTTDWFYDEVAYVYEEGIMNGTTDTTFDPNGTLTRAMVVTMLYRMENEPNISAAGTFSDVSRGQWYTEAVEWAAAENIVNGVGNGKFAPNDPITREQLATILYRYLTEYDGESADATASLASFSDAGKVSSYAETAMKWATGAKIITGDNGKLMPQGKATRAQAAAMIARFMQ